MAVYIDDYNAAFQRMIMCHMIADTTEELITAAEAAGVSRRWIQYPGDANEHFDICLSSKKKVVANGAIEISARDYARMVNERRSGALMNPPPLKPKETLF